MRCVWEAQNQFGKLALLSGAALAFLFASGAAAQTAFELPQRSANSVAPVLHADSSAPPPAATPPPVDDALGQHGFYLEANSLTRDDKNNLWIARGQVEARYQGRVLRGDEVIYNVGSGTVIVNGHGQIIQADGTAVFGDHVVLDDKMRAGFARGFSTHETQNITVAADVAIRRSETVNDLRRAIYTPCNVCAENGDAKEPTWSIQASEMTEDRTRHLVSYKNAVIRVKGVPVFYTPVFWHPDPDSPPTSGLLAPKISINGKRGLSYEQPYLQVISPSTQLFISPQLNTTVNPFLNLEYRERFYSGELDVRAGYTYDQDFDSHGHKFGDLTSRSYILADGEFDLNQNWSWGFGVERTSDPLLFEKYSIPDVFEDNRGIYSTDSQRLLTQLFTTRQDTDSYFSLSLLSFQGLRQGPNPNGSKMSVTENNSVFPFVAPLIEGRWDPDFDIAGGQLHFVGSAVALSASDSPFVVGPVTTANPDGTPIEGPNSRRASADLDWTRNFTLDNGIRLQPYADLRGDIYNISDVTTTSPSGVLVTDPNDKTLLRGVPTIGLNFNWPFVKQSGGTTIVLEPIAQLALSPNIKLDPEIPNYDSAVFQYDETSLFEADKFPGYDVFDSGQRLNIGGRATFTWDGGASARFLVGQTFRAAPTTIFPEGTGLNNTSSDWVVSADVTPFTGLEVYARGLVDAEGNVPLADVGTNFAFQGLNGYLRYQLDNTDPATKFTDLEGAAEFFFTKHWGLGLSGVRDLEFNAWRLRDISLIYKDECIRVQVIYQHQDTIQGQLGASDTVLLRLTLATLGAEGYRDTEIPH
ncbi:MAG TPA: LPS assembly protein LptD [Caulobacteraceae bacterium]|nr:LPS assembly protein LptD [Caulobacteraceae bacterium]